MAILQIPTRSLSWTLLFQAPEMNAALLEKVITANPMVPASTNDPTQKLTHRRLLKERAISFAALLIFRWDSVAAGEIFKTWTVS